MNFSQEVSNDILIEIINLKRATITESDEFKKILLKAIADGWRKVVIDFKYCSFMDSTFLGSLVLGLKEIAKVGGDLRIAEAHGDSQEIIELTGTSRIFQTFKTREEAILSFNTKKTA